MKRISIDTAVVVFYYVDLDHERGCKYWETIAMDRFRFERRIKEMEKILLPVLKKKIDEINK